MDKILKRESYLLEMLADVYIFMIIIIFPLIVDKTGFFHILEVKWHAFVNISSIYLVSNIFIILYYLIFKKYNYLKNIKFTWVQWCSLIYLAVNILSFIFSPFIRDYDLLIGVGRGEGLIVTSLYILTFLFISIFGKFKKKHILYFSISNILVSLIMILQYIGFNPLNMYQDGIGTHNVSFMGTIGNKDFISAIFTIFLTISVSSYIFLDNNKKEKIVNLLAIFMGYFIFGVINVSSGKLAFLLTLVVFLPYIILNNERLSRFLIVISTILMAYCINVVINPVYHYNLGRIILHWQFNLMIFLFIIVSGLLILLSIILQKYNFNELKNKKIIKYYYILIFAGGLIGIFGIYLINFKSGFLYEVHEILHGNLDDSFGTFRIFLWKRSLSLVNDYPIIGSGPDTFAIRFMAKYTADVASIGELTINDTAANVYLTILINLGIVGLISYLTFIFSQIKYSLKNINKYSLVLFTALISYLIQDFFNLSVVIVSPIYWLLMALLCSSICSKIVDKI